jgi:hypothetical protein
MTKVQPPSISQPFRFEEIFRFLQFTVKTPAVPPSIGAVRFSFSAKALPPSGRFRIIPGTSEDFLTSISCYGVICVFPSSHNAVDVCK